MFLFVCFVRLCLFVVCFVLFCFIIKLFDYYLFYIVRGWNREGGGVKKVNEREQGM